MDTSRLSFLLCGLIHVALDAGGMGVAGGKPEFAAGQGLWSCVLLAPTSLPSPRLQRSLYVSLSQNFRSQRGPSHHMDRGQKTQGKRQYSLLLVPLRL